MDREQLIAKIEKETGLPAVCLTGETEEEIVAQAKALLAFRREQDAQRVHSLRDQLEEWLHNQPLMDPEDEAGAWRDTLRALLEIARTTGA